MNGRLGGSALTVSQADTLQRNRRPAAPVDTLAAATGCTPAQVTLEWLPAQGEDVVVIPGMRAVDA